MKTIHTFDVPANAENALDAILPANDVAVRDNIVAEADRLTNGKFSEFLAENSSDNTPPLVITGGNPDFNVFDELIFEPPTQISIDFWNTIHNPSNKA